MDVGLAGERLIEARAHRQRGFVGGHRLVERARIAQGIGEVDPSLGHHGMHGLEAQRLAVGGGGLVEPAPAVQHEAVPRVKLGAHRIESYRLAVRLDGLVEAARRAACERQVCARRGVVGGMLDR